MGLLIIVLTSAGATLSAVGFIRLNREERRKASEYSNVPAGEGTGPTIGHFGVLLNQQHKAMLGFKKSNNCDIAIFVVGIICSVAAGILGTIGTL